MSIQALPNSTVRQIGASQVLVDPSSVVKELIDNSLDARATNVSVEISANIIDVIQVRDNGHSIAPEDRPMICRRYCTSKIRDFSDLRDVGGKWLGFRGEALASLAEMSGGLAITTRTEGEAVATLLNIGRDGEIEAQERASHPVGTTVRTTDFFKGLPVRKQAALKHTVKYLAQIKRLMQAYALARPSVRFSLRVLKAKNGKGNFVYAPKPGASVVDVAYKILGINCANQSMWSVLKSHGFEIQAFLPKPEADAAKIGNLGQFISVDSRPISTTRGTFKQITALYKEKLKRASVELEAVKDPFLCMNIVCPPNSYDPNIEPAKDDVMFDDASKVLEAVEELLQATYPEVSSCDLGQQLATEDESTQSYTTVVQKNEEGGSKPVSSSLPKSPPVIHVHEDQDDEVMSIPSPKRRSTWKSNMYDYDDQDLASGTSKQQEPENDQPEELEQVQNDVALFNPWTMARMNAPVKNKDPSASSSHQPTPLKERTDVQVNVATSTPRTAALPTHVIQHLLTPQTLSPVRIGNAYDSSELDQYIQRLPTPHQTPLIHRSLLSDDIANISTPQRSDSRPAYDFVSARMLEPDTPLSSIPGAPISRRLNFRRDQLRPRANKPFNTPINPEANNWFDHLSPQGRSRQSFRNRKQAQPSPDDLYQRTLREMITSAAEGEASRSTQQRNEDIRSSITANDSSEPRILQFNPQVDENEPLTDKFNERSLRVTGMAVSDRVGVSIRQFRSPLLDRETPLDEPTGRTVESVRPIKPAVTLPSEINDRSQALSHVRTSTKLSEEPVRRQPAATESQRNTVENTNTANEDGIHEPPLRRRRTTGNDSRRLKRNQSINADADLLLGSIPADSRLHSVTVKLATSVPSISHQLRKLNTVGNAPEWGSPPESAYDTFATAAVPGVVRELAHRLMPLLQRLHPGEDVVQDLGAFVMDAVQLHNAEAATMFAP